MLITSSLKTKYFDAAMKAYIVPVSAGKYSISNEDNIFFATTLGSCIAVCMRDPIVRLGGMNHIMLPGREDGGRKNDSAELFGDYAMEILINGIVRAGGKKDRLQAKVFGGANVLSAIEGMSIGECNSKFVNKFLMHEGISILATDTGGTHARRIMFNPYDGSVLVNSLGINAVTDVVKNEALHRKQLQKSDSKSNIEIFR